MNIIRAALAILAGAASAPTFAEPPSLPLTLSGMYYHGPSAVSQPAQLALGAAAPHFAIELPPVSAAERSPELLKSRDAADAIATRPGPRPLGIGREVPPALASVELSSLRWHPVAGGGIATRIAFRSPGAVALRTEIAYAGPHDGLTLSFASTTAGSEVFGPYSTSDLETMSRWSPLIDGDTMTIEIALPPGAVPAGRSLSIPRVAHNDISIAPRNAGMLKATGATRATDGIGASGACNIDIACVAAQQPAAAAAAASSARITFVMNGRSFDCSGQLVNSVNAQGQPTQIPYFLTANHCIAASSVAGTIQFFWFFEATSCLGSTVGANHRTTTGGGTLLYTSVDVDATLLRLNVAPPAGVFLAGWDATPPMPGTPIHALHHPNGDLTKYSAGTVGGYGHFCDFVDAAGNCRVSQGSYIRVTWQQGTTEGGSSGGALFTADSTGAYRLRGVLHGGGASCASPSAPDFFSRFDLAYPAISHLLSGVEQPAAGPNAIEFYNVDLDHYFLTSFAAETASIEAGSAGPGWVRTGHAFPIGGQLPVCRFYGPGPNSHFYTADAAECAQVKRDPGWIYEAIAFNINQPAAQQCPPGTIPIFRTYNNGFVTNNSNHRYTTSAYTQQWMQAQPSVMSVFFGRPESAARWSAEGAVMCAPS